MFISSTGAEFSGIHKNTFYTSNEMQDREALFTLEVQIYVQIYSNRNGRQEGFVCI